MSGERDRGTSGGAQPFAGYETREIVIAEGLDFHESDLSGQNQQNIDGMAELEADPTAWTLSDTEEHQWLGRIVAHFRLNRRGRSVEDVARRLIRKIDQFTAYSDFQYLEKIMGDEITVQSDRANAEHINHQQQVRYLIKVIHRKDEFKTALGEEGKIVIYSGHSRYGRGACFDTYDGTAIQHGDQWENGHTGRTDQTGLFRLGFDYIAIPLEDMEHHKYHFAPMKVEDPAPPTDRRVPHTRHPNMRRTRRFRRVTLTDPLKSRVSPDFASPSDKYWGLRRERKIHLVFRAGWHDTEAAPFDLDSVTDMNCRTFCHFGCSTKTHYWEIVRKGSYYSGFTPERPRTPDTKLAYFTRRPSDWRTCFWIHSLITCPYPPEENHWYRTHEYAKDRANRMFRRGRASIRFSIF